jgi:hypothetical protein
MWFAFFTMESVLTSLTLGSIVKSLARSKKQRSADPDVQLVRLVDEGNVSSKPQRRTLDRAFRRDHCAYSSPKNQDVSRQRPVFYVVQVQSDAVVPA